MRCSDRPRGRVADGYAEWYDPDQITTENGSLVITFDRVTDPATNVRPFDYHYTTILPRVRTAQLAVQVRHAAELESGALGCSLRAQRPCRTDVLPRRL